MSLLAFNSSLSLVLASFQTNAFHPATGEHILEKERKNLLSLNLYWIDQNVVYEI